ncbi:hypothetical protein HK102_001886, partial [Quaeritorhiza haematococci]
LDLTLRRLLYSNHTTYSYECGGLTKDILRLTNDEIIAYHKKYYDADRVVAVVAGGGIGGEREKRMVFERLAEVVGRGAVDGEGEDVKVRGGTVYEPAPELVVKDVKEGSAGAVDARKVMRTVKFPSADEDVGSIGYGWRGPPSSDFHTLTALEILFRYLHETSASALMQAFVEMDDSPQKGAAKQKKEGEGQDDDKEEHDDEDPWASDIDFEVKVYVQTCFFLIFSGVPFGGEGDEEEEGDEDDESGEMDVDEADAEEDDGDEEWEDMDEDGEGSEEGDESDEEITDEDDDDESDDDENGENAESERKKRNLFAPDVYSSRMDKVIRRATSGDGLDLNRLRSVAARHRRKVLEALDEDSHECVVGGFIVPEIVRWYLTRDHTSANPTESGGPIDPSRTRAAQVFATIADLIERPASFWTNLAEEWILKRPYVEVMMQPDAALADEMARKETEEREKRVAEYGEEGLKKLGEVARDAVKEGEVNLPDEVVKAMPGVPDVGKAPKIKAESMLLDVGQVEADIAAGGPGGPDGVQKARPFSVIQVVETESVFAHLRIGVNTAQIPRRLRPYLVLFQELLFQTGMIVPKTAGGDVSAKKGGEEGGARILDYREVSTLTADLLVSNEASVGFGNDIWHASWLSEVFMISGSGEVQSANSYPSTSPTTGWRDVFQHIIRVLVGSEFDAERAATVAKNLRSELVETRRSGSEMLVAVSTRVTAPTTPATASTTVARGHASTVPAGYQVEQDDWENNEIAISVFQQDAFLKGVLGKIKNGKGEEVVRALREVRDILIGGIIGDGRGNRGLAEVSGFVQIAVPLKFGGTDGKGMMAKWMAKEFLKMWDQETEFVRRFRQQQQQPETALAMGKNDCSVRKSPFPFPRKPFDLRRIDWSIFGGQERRESATHDGPPSKKLKGAGRGRSPAATVRSRGAAHTTGKKRNGGGRSTTVRNGELTKIAQSERMGAEEETRHAALLVPIGGLQTSFLLQIVECDVLQSQRGSGVGEGGISAGLDMDYHAVVMLAELLSRTEGVLYNAIRGNGLAYGAYLTLYLWSGQLTFELQDSSEPRRALLEFYRILSELGTSEGFDKICGQWEVETARAAVLYRNACERASGVGVVGCALRSALKGFTSLEDYDGFQQKLYAVTREDLKRVYEKYFSRFLEWNSRVTVMTTQPGASAKKLMKEFATASPISVVSAAPSSTKDGGERTGEDMDVDGKKREVGGGDERVVVRFEEVALERLGVPVQE